MHTGSRAFCFLMALAGIGTEVASAAPAATPIEPGQYRVEVKVVSVPRDAAKEISTDVHNAYYSETVVGRLLRAPHVSVLSCPVVEASSTNPATIDVTKTFTCSGKSREVGVKFSATPDTKADPGSRYQLTFSNVKLGGFADPKATQPVFNTQRLSTAMTVFHPPSEGYCCFELLPNDHSVATYDADGRRSASVADANERQLLFVKITRG